MVLVVEDGSSVENANTYADLDAVNTYHGAMGNRAWSGAASARESAILRGMAYLESMGWHGRKKTRAQALSWPRIGVVDADGYAVPGDEVPHEVITALCEAALVELQEPGALRKPVQSGGQTTSLRIDGVVTETYTPGTGEVMHKSILAPLRGLIANRNVVRVELA